MEIETMLVKLGTWNESKDQAMPIRMAVFVHEQNVPPEEESDAMDPLCIHALAMNDQGSVIGTGRLLPDGHIGRMSVLKDHRATGVGSAILLALINEARSREHAEIVLHAQIHARDFYVRHGFVEEGEVFYEANIPHVRMRMTLLA